MQRNILIAGYYGFGNTGDEAILKSMLDQFRAIRSNLEFTIISGNPEWTASHYDVNAIHWRDIPAISATVKASDLVILGGGGLFQEYWEYKQEQLLTPKHHSMSFYGGIPVLAALYERPLVIYAVGIGPVRTENGKKLIRFAADQAIILSVRDEESRNLLQSLGVNPGKIHITVDPAFGLAPAKETSKTILKQLHIHKNDGPLLGVSLRNWKIGVSSSKWKMQIAHVLDRFITTFNGSVLFMPFQSIPGDELQDDVSAARDIIQTMARADRTHNIETVHSPDVLAGLITQCDFVFGMRLHSLIFGIHAAVPVMGLSYDPKIDLLLTRFGQEEYLFSIKKFHEDNLVLAIQNILEKKELLQKNLVEQSRRAKEECSEFSQRVMTILDTHASARNAPKLEEFLRHLTIEKIDRVAALEIKADELEGLYSSNAWQEFRIYRDIRQRLAPDGSTFSNVLSNVQRGIVTLKKKGWKAFLRSISERVVISMAHVIEPVLQTSTKLENELNAILKKHADAKGVVLILPNIEWNVSLFQRPQQMALAFAREGYLVLYLELSYVMFNKKIREIQERLHRVPVPANRAVPRYADIVPFETLHMLNKPITITYTYNMQFLEYLQNPRIVYEYIDELEVFPYDRDFLLNNHSELISSADVIVATAKHLHDDVLAERKDAILCPNGVDYVHFSPSRNPQTAQAPKDLQGVLRPGHPVIGYYGALARWFDYDLLAEVARRRSEWDFLLIGVDYDNTLHSSGILKVPNVHWLGPRPYSDLPEYLKCFDVATIPFKVNEITHSTSPLKMFEYFAGHKPVVATAMHEVQRYHEVMIAHDVQEFISRTEEALTLKNTPEFTAKLDKVARENTWDARVKQILDAIKES